MPVKGIAHSIGRTSGAVQFQVSKLDLSPRRDLRRWTDEEVADVVRLRNEKHLSFDQIGEILIRSGRSVQHKLIEQGVVSFHRKPWEPEEFQRLQELLAIEYSWPTILQKLSVGFPKGRAVQELVTKLRDSDLGKKTEFEVKRAQLEQLISEGLLDKVIAERLGIIRKTVGKWKRRLRAEKEAKPNNQT